MNDNSRPDPSENPDLPEEPSEDNQQGWDEMTWMQDSLHSAAARDLSQRTIQPPSHIENYEIHNCLGEGAYGTVWLASEISTGKKYAIKFYNHQRGLDWSLLNREVEKLAVLYTSRNVVQLKDVGWEGEPPYFIMEYLEKGSLSQHLEQGSLSMEESVRIIKAITEALAQAHDSGILHCDIKPANVLLDSNNEPRLSDFGQSRLTSEQNPSLGTLYYMAPEQADLQAIPDSRWDVYALGVLLYQMLTGKIPYTDSPPLSSSKKYSSEYLISKPTSKPASEPVPTLEMRLATYQKEIAEASPPNAHRKLKGIDHHLIDIIDGCLARDPQKRFSNVKIVLERLQQRDRDRHRKPLLILGILAPLLLLLSLVPVANSAIRSAVQKSEQSLTNRALAGDVISARLLATILHRELEDRRTELIQYAQEPQLHQTILKDRNKKWEERTDLRSVLDGMKRAADQKRTAINRPTDTSWFLTNHKGDQIYRNPPSTTLGQNFAHRDYYHGLGFEYDRSKIPEDVTPIAKAYISQSFKSDATGQFMVSITVPVWNKDRSEVIGILGRTTHLWKLLSEWEQSIQGESRSRVVALIDSRNGRLLSHPWMTKNNLAKLSPDQLEKLKLSKTQQQSLKKLRHAKDKNEIAGAEQSDNYTDPVHVFDNRYDERWLAAFGLVGDTGWVTVIQEVRETALSPVEQVQQVLIRYGLIGIAIAVFLISLFWFLLPRLFFTQGTEPQDAIQTSR